VLADAQLLDGEVPAEVHDQVHHLGQDHRVDDVPGEDESGLVALLVHRLDRRVRTETAATGMRAAIQMTAMAMAIASGPRAAS